MLLLMFGALSTYSTVEPVNQLGLRRGNRRLEKIT